MSTTGEPIVESRLAKALSHPLRFRLLTLLNEGVASPSELATRLGEPLGNVSYHVRTLADLGCIELVSTRPVRGAVEHHYRATMRPFLTDEDWASLPLSVRRSIAGDLLRRVWQDMAAAHAQGGLDRPDAHVSRTDLVLDEVGLEELTALVASTLDRALEIQAESVGRLTESGDGSEQSLHSKLLLLHFLVGDGADPDQSR